MIVTFYSFKGGVGRSMALANVAEILADVGYRVMVFDWDLEAPGLERSFTKTQVDSDQIAAQPGLMDLLRSYKETLAGALTPPAARETRVKVGDVWLTRPSSYAIRVSGSVSGGSVHLLTAGARPKDAYSKYADEVRDFDWKEFYDEWAGGSYIDFVRTEMSIGIQPADGPWMPAAADLVLVDSRTGVTEHGGVCTHHLADLVVILSAANDSNFYGSLRIAQSLTAPNLFEKRSGRPLRVLPVRARVEQTAQIGELNDFRKRFTDEFMRFLPEGFPGSFFDDAEIPYIPLYSFGEVNLAREEQLRTREPKIYNAYHVLADAIVECGIAGGFLRDTSRTTGTLRNVARRTVDRLRDVRGTFAIVAGSETAGLASAVTSELTRLGATVATRGDAVQGYILLVGAGTSEHWVRAQFDELLRRRALDPELRITSVVTSDATPAAASCVSRAPVLAVDARTATVSSSRLSNELAGPLGAIALESPTRCPYPGPRPFDDTEAPFFFGRDKELQQVVAGVSVDRPLLIEGPPGVGKTSFLNAAVIPAARRGELAMLVGPWVLYFAPSDNPLAEFAAALEKRWPLDAKTIEARMKADEGWLATQLSEATASSHDPMVIAVDGLDRLLAPRIQNEAREVLSQFDVVLSRHAPAVFVATLRTDIEPPVHAFVQKLRSRALTVRLEPLSPQQIGDAVAVPARVAGLTLDTRLPDRVAFEAAEIEAPLAVVQTALRMMWQRRTGEALTEAAFQTNGGLKAASIEVANLRLQGLTDTERLRIQRLFATIALAWISTGIPRKRALAIAGGGLHAERTLERLSESPAILDFPSSKRVRLAPYLRSTPWEALRTWTDHERARRDRRLWIARGVAAVLLIAVAAWIYVGMRNAQLRREVTALAVRAQQRFQDNPIEGLRLAVQSAEAAIRVGDKASRDSATSALEQALGKRYPRVILMHDGPVSTVAFSPDSKAVATGDDGGSVRVWNPSDGTRALVVKHTAPVRSVRFSPDGRSFVTGSFDQTVAGWNAATGAQLWRHGTNQRIVATDISANGDVAFAGQGGSVWIRRRAGAVTELKAHSAGVTTASFSRDGRYLLTASIDGSAKLWDVETLHATTLPGLGSGRVTGAFAFDGETIAVVGRGGFVRAITGALGQSAEQPFILRTLSGPSSDQEASVVFGSRGYLVTVGERAGPRIWDPRGNLVANILLGNAGVWVDAATSGATVVDAEPHPNELQFVLADSHGHATIWSLNAPAAWIDLDAHQAALRAAQFSPDGRWIVTASEDASAAVWDATDSTVAPGSGLDALLERAKAIMPKVVSSAPAPRGNGQQ